MNENLVTIHLGGKLGKMFGKLWNLNVSSPAEAIRAISINTAGKFLEYLDTEGRNKYYKVCVGNKKNTLSSDELTGRTGKSDIYIIPVIKMSGAVAKIIVGALLVVAGIYLSLTGNPMIGYALISTGLGLIVGGIIELMTPIPKMQKEDNRTSSVFQGNASVIAQNTPVGLIYGRVLVAPMPISLSLDNYQADSTSKSTIKNPILVENSDGSFYYDYSK
jgi:predicted phage tail protein